MSDKCPNCDTINPPGAALCDGCNQPIPKPKAPPPVVAKVVEDPALPLLRDAVRCLQIIAMFVALLVSGGAAVAIAAKTGSYLISFAVFWLAMLVFSVIVFLRTK